METTNGPAPKKGFSCPKPWKLKANKPHTRVTYTVEGLEWTCAAHECLLSDFGVTVEELPKFHNLVRGNELWWNAARWLYGLNPSDLPKDDPSFATLISKPVLYQKLNISRKPLERQLRYLSDAWVAIGGSVPSLKPRQPEQETFVPVPKTIKNQEDAASPPKLKPCEPLPKLSQEESDLFLRYGFSDDLFGNLGTDRSVSERFAERYWFITRIRELSRLLEEPMVAQHARMALQNELFSRRVSDSLCRMEPTTPQFAKLQTAKASLEDEYRRQWDKIEELCPFARQLNTKNALGQHISLLTQAMQEYKGNKNNELVDGVRTAYELQILMRDAQQHSVRYRPGQTAYILEAMKPENLWNPNWKNLFPDYLTGAIDSGFKEGFTRAREARGAQLPNLEIEGPAGEYQALHDPQSHDHQEVEADIEATEEPETAVPILENVSPA